MSELIRVKCLRCNTLHYIKIDEIIWYGTNTFYHESCPNCRHNIHQLNLELKIEEKKDNE